MKSFKLGMLRSTLQKGLTLVELMISLILVSLITLAILALYNMTAATYKTTDANQQLQDNARFIFEIFSQAVRQAGLQDASQYAILREEGGALPSSYIWEATSAVVPPNALFGFNNATVVSTGNVNDFGAHNTGSAANGFSDVFVVRYFGSSRLDGHPIDINVADGSVVDCRGVPVPYPQNTGSVGLSILRVAVSNGEPELQCINAARAQAWNIVRGVESLQIMYAVDTDAATDPTPNRWLNAQQVDAAGQWAQVKMIRIGMVLRGPIGSAERQAPALYPLGEEFSKIGGSVSAEQGLTFVPPSDGRLRKTFAFNISIRNTL